MKEDYMNEESRRDASVTEQSRRDASVTNQSRRDASVTNQSRRDASVTNQSRRDAGVTEQSRRDASVTNQSRRDASVPKVKVVLFSGGRGSRVLSQQLIRNPQVDLTLAINGYDDGASTGEVRRFLGDSLGPSDFRKNSSRLAGELQSCRPELIELLDLRFPVDFTPEQAANCFRILSGSASQEVSEFEKQVAKLEEQIEPETRGKLARWLSLFEQERKRTGRPFCFSDCSLGNIVFAGCFLDADRNFNAAVAAYCSMLNLPSGLVENVTDGTNAYLVALNRDLRLLGSEAEIVDANKRNHIQDIFLIDRPVPKEDQQQMSSAQQTEIAGFLQRHAKSVSANPNLLKKITEADLIIYSPGTQHSSLFPSYITPGLGTAIANNLTAIKLLVTNVQEDAEIPDSSAVDIIEKAVYYLKEKNTLAVPTPCLITHYLINEPGKPTPEAPYIPLGRLESLEDPRLVRIGNYEEGVTGRHDAAKVLTPFIESILQKGEEQRIAILLMETGSLNKISQTILEMLRGGIHRLPMRLIVFYSSSETLDGSFTDSLPFPVENTGSFPECLRTHPFDYIILFESSGMYKGEDIVNVASLLNHRRLDAVWGSRRLSIRDIHESYRLRYRHNVILGAISYLGSHVLSLAYLLLYGRYISDTLSGVRAVRSGYLHTVKNELQHKYLNHDLLSALLRDRADIFETPVQFFSLSPEKVRRTTIFDGVHSLMRIVRWRLKRPVAPQQ